METITHSALDGHSVRPLVFKNVEDYDDLHRIGLGGFDEIMSGGLADRFAADSIQTGVTTASIPVQLQFLQQFLPGFVYVMTAARKIDELIGINTAGNWEDEEVVQGVIENTGTAVPYGDETNVPLASWNENWVPRTVVRFELGMRVDYLEAKRSARIMVDTAGRKRESCGLILEQQRNMVGFYGYNSGNNYTYGFLNDPNLPAYKTVAASGTGSSTLWSTKNFQEITADLITAFAQLQTQSQDTINPEDVPTTLALATADYQYLSVTTDFGLSVREWLRQTYPKCRVVSAPQLNGANGGANVFYIYADAVRDLSSDDGKTFAQLVPAKFQVLGVQQLTKGYEEDYSNATAGVMVKRPWACVRYSGI
ncbi:major capsid family protein [Fimbriiglobus ruber]|uniref:Phage capsid and scaffold n=1 Tax=Fimbriiglobus ruber TaxID=1908690 RepID=A0A225DIB5_9BACT|nr:major capsid family protein [Fimbriiglobus ruber]OWK36909.1 Phage capsid and scaffold [Fimbriiglobus ruber]OWK42052.1 Phage capsid and scaffold [Fimbriiglobus ruber]